MKYQLRQSEYAVAIADKKSDDFRSQLQEQFTILKNGFTYWVADPFVFEHQGQTYIFAEMYLYTKGRGVIAYCKKNNHGFSKWKIAIEEPYHLSFPNIFEHNGKIFICPEANESNEIYLYEAKQFPDKWKKTKIIISGGHYADTVFLNTTTHQYAFSEKTTNNKKEQIIFRFSENNKTSTIKIKKSLGVEFSRAAGKIISYGVNNILVSQICTPNYGSGIIFKDFKIEDNNFSENEITRYYPKNIEFKNNKKLLTGLHTFNSSEHFTVIDVRWERIKIFEVLCMIIRKLNKALKKPAY